MEACSRQPLSAHSAEVDNAVVPQTDTKQSEREAAVRDWTARFGRRPPKNLSTVFMRRALSFEHQCAQSPALKRLSTRLQKDFKIDLKAGTARSDLAVGCHLVRQWNGRTYQVDVTADGFVLDGKSYRSLSAIAKKITGTNWSGPRFFGLNGRKAFVSDGAGGQR
ncbi:DUF2924 domain-containing protein [Roseibium denhamense]|uniref:DUF2924 domain-containing protein n=1 Tax=Roseibium denhamense TaxID=76305 RepID=A0ABY1PPJ6_9HYPH|nr:DUF2924 domain-containing protein [Roseibium denhamense]MTI03939.1 DUF2924 domain-containing protein [Roseibium denhamense]SMP37518.1 Protein of unknown function [Roseibium denhamense]